MVTPPVKGPFNRQTAARFFRKASSDSMNRRTEASLTNFSDIVDLSRAEVLGRVDDVGKGPAFQRGQWRWGRRPLVVGRYASDVFGCWRKTCKTASRRLNRGSISCYKWSDVSVDVTGVAERKLTTHPPSRATDSHVPLLAYFSQKTSPGNQNQRTELRGELRFPGSF